MPNIKDPNYKRIGVMLPNELYDRLNKHIQWGERNRMLVSLLTWVCDVLDQYGDKALILFLRGASPVDLLRMMLEEAKDGDN